MLPSVDKTSHSMKSSKERLKPIKLPDWWSKPELTLDYYPSAEKYDGNVRDICNFPVDEQESLIVHDLILCMSGVEDRGLSASLRELAKRVLELCCDYSFVVRFQQSFGGDEQGGQVLHSFCDALNDVLKDYHIFIGKVCSLKPLPSLQALWCLCQPMRSNMATLASLVEIGWHSHTGSPKSAEILNQMRSLLDRTVDPCEQKLIECVLNKAAKPYVDKILPRFLSSGIVFDDPYNEFELDDESDKLPYFLEPFTIYCAHARQRKG
ncbi:hypothetical protein ACOME3_006827 [Neoechinorhynchus agilis]